MANKIDGPTPNQHPSQVVWEITGTTSQKPLDANARQLTPTQIRSFIDQVAAANPSLFILTGGNPLEHNNLEEIITYAVGKGLRIAISVDATPRLIAPKAVNLHQLKRLGLTRILLNLDGATKETHDKLVGITGSWDWTMQLISTAKEIGLEFQINTRVTRNNTCQITPLAQLLESLQPVLWNVFPRIPEANVSRNDLLGATELEELFEQLYRLSKSVSSPIRASEGPHFRRIELQNSKQTPRITKTRDGKGSIFVSSTGNVYPSSLLPCIAGNILENNLLDLYRNSRIFRELRDPTLLKGKCGYCDFNAICGGSRARAYAITGDYLAEEPLCKYQPLGEADSWRMYCDD